MHPALAAVCGGCIGLLIGAAGTGPLLVRLTIWVGMGAWFGVLRWGR